MTCEKCKEIQLEAYRWLLDYYYHVDGKPVIGIHMVTSDLCELITHLEEDLNKLNK